MARRKKVRNPCVRPIPGARARRPDGGVVERVVVPCGREGAPRADVLWGGDLPRPAVLCDECYLGVTTRGVERFAARAASLLLAGDRERAEAAE